MQLPGFYCKAQGENIVAVNEMSAEHTGGLVGLKYCTKKKKKNLHGKSSRGNSTLIKQR